MSQINRLSNGGRIDRNKVLSFTFNGQNYNWQSWSDGGQPSHVITAPSSATTYTVYYRKK